MTGGDLHLPTQRLAFGIVVGLAVVLSCLNDLLLGRVLHPEGLILPQDELGRRVLVALGTLLRSEQCWAQDDLFRSRARQLNNCVVTPLL